MQVLNPSKWVINSC